MAFALCWPAAGWGDRVDDVRVLPRPEVILTHESDLDGLVAGLLLQRLAQHLFAAEVPLEAFHYNNWRLREPREKSGWVCDLSFEARLDKPDWVVIDHHATELKPTHALLIHDLSKSAGLLCYELCRENGLGSPEQKRRWLAPLLAGEIRSAFCMTEPEVASSDATNMQATAVLDGDEVVVNGRKWWSTGIGHPNCEAIIFMGLTDPEADRYHQHSMVLVPLATPGVKVERMLPTMGFLDAPGGHGEVSFT